MPEQQLAGLVHFLQSVVDPVDAAFRDAPIEDETISAEEERGTEEARQWLAQNAGRGVPHAEAMRRLGLD